jgi:hypothetical protein
VAGDMTKNDAMHFWYNPKTKMYEEGDEMGPDGQGDYGPVYIAPTKKLLEDIGTRFAHLNDLTDYLGEGLTSVTNSLARYDNESDRTRKIKLEGALAFIRIYQDQMANYDGKKWEFNKMLDECAPTRATLDAIKADRIKAAEDKKNAAIKAAQTGANPTRLLGEGSTSSDAEV